jgi:hypothetical protein
MTPPWTLRNLLYGSFVFLCATALVWPGFPMFGNRIEPYVLGLPFGLAWNIGWVIASFSALWMYHLTGPKDE